MLWIEAHSLLGSMPVEVIRDRRPPFERSPCSSGQDRNRTVSCHCHLALHSRCLWFRPVQRQRRLQRGRDRPFQQARSPWPLPVRLPRAQAPSAFAFRRSSVRSRRTRSARASRGTPRCLACIGEIFRPRRSPGRPWSPGVPGTSLPLPHLPAPQNTWEYIQAQGNAPEVPRWGTFLARVTCSGEDGGDLGYCLAGGGDYRRLVLGGGMDLLAAKAGLRRSQFLEPGEEQPLRLDR